MRTLFYLSLLTLKELTGQRIYQVLLGFVVIAPWLAMIPASLFLLDIGKVYIDLLFLCLHGWLLIYLFFIACPLLGRDIEQGTCHIFLALPMQRWQYYWARYTGIIAAFFPLLIAFLISAACAFALADYMWSGYIQSGANAAFNFGAVLILLPYIALAAVLFLIASRATGLPEITVFLFSVWILCWSIPPVLDAMQENNVHRQTPPAVSMILHASNQLLPSLSSSRISLSLAHGRALEAVEVTAYCAQQLAYALLVMLIATALFKRRNLL